METLASRLISTMEERGFNPNSLAQKVGITRPAMAKIVKGDTLNPKKIVEIAEVLNVNPQWLKTGEGKKQAVKKTQSSADCDCQEWDTLDRLIWEEVQKLNGEQKFQLAQHLRNVKR